MAIVIPFVPTARSNEASLRGAPQPSGSILFFTGVRYERHPEPVVAPEPALAGKRALRSKTMLRAKAPLRTKSAGQPA